jgi:cellulose synthase/poly-beta-1,6-N-acetylglucosamine synthase-like glycosyltransferase
MQEQVGINPFFIVCARNKHLVENKILELEQINIPFIIVCGEKFNHPNVLYKKAIGKWDAINFGAKYIPERCDVIILNDVDTKIHNLKQALDSLNDQADITYCRVIVSRGPQVKFYKILDPIRGRLHIAASGEFMLMKRTVWEKMLPVPPCTAEDSYILFRALELGYKASFCTTAYVTTERTTDAKHEEGYKTRTTLGIYQALQYTKPPIWINIFYALLPLAAPLLTLAGEDGRAWMRGIEKAANCHIQKKYTTKF